MGVSAPTACEKSPMTARLALFDLDNTLLAGDSDHAWGEFLISQHLVDEASHRATNDYYYQQYLDGELTRAEMVDKSVAATRQLAKRQLTWLRKYSDTHRLDYRLATPPDVAGCLQLEPTA